MDNTQILEDILAFIKNQVQSGKADYYLSIVNSPTESHKRLKQATQIVDNWEKKPSHANPNEYTLHDIIDLVILYEYARNAGNGDVFVDAVTADMDLIKKGPVFQQYSQMFAKNDPNKPKSAVATPKTTPNPRKIPNNHGSTPTRPVHNLEELRKLADEQFLKELSELLKNANPDTFTYYTFNEGLQDASKKDNSQIMREKLNSAKHKSLYEHPSLYATDDIIQLVLEYLEAVDIGQGTRYALAIQQDISSIKKAGCLRELLKDISPTQKIVPKQLQPEKWPATPRGMRAATDKLSQDAITYYFAIGDLHGWKKPLESAVAYLEENFKGKYKLVLTGDCIDKGPEGLEIMKYLISLGDKVRLIKGNHEVMMKKVFDVLKKHNELENGTIDWDGVRTDLKFMTLSIRAREKERQASVFEREGQWIAEYAQIYQSKRYDNEVLDDLKNWMDPHNGGIRTILRITGQLGGFIESIGDDEVVTNKELENILAYIDNAPEVIPLINVRNPNNLQQTKAVLMSHSAPPRNISLLKKLRETGMIPRLQGSLREIVSIREQDYREKDDDPIKLAADAGFDEFIHGHEPIKDDQHVKSEIISYKNGKKIRFTSLDGNMQSLGGYNNKGPKANLYCINTGEIRQYDREGTYVRNLQLTDAIYR